MSLSDVRGELQGRLQTITELTVHKQVPQSVGKLPCAIPHVEAGDYQKVIGAGMVEWQFRLLLLVAQQDSDAAWTELDNYLEKSGDKSVKAAVEGASEAAPRVGDFAAVLRVENAGYIGYRGKTWIGAEFVVIVADSS